MNPETLNPAPAPESPVPVSPTPPSPQTAKPKRNWLPIVVIVLLLAGLVAVGLWGMGESNTAKNNAKEITDLSAKRAALTKQLDTLQNSTGIQNVQKDAYQSVFLTNGQVYFGKISDITASQLTLKDIFYIADTPSGSNVGSTGNNVKLVKLGNEMHGPKDVMYIERKNVQFWENLKADSQVSKAITAYNKQNP